MRIAVIACTVLVWAGDVRAQAPAAPEPPVVVVEGEGVLRLAPDQAFVTVGAEARAASPQTAQASTAEAMSAVQQRLAAAGIPAAAMRTVSVSLQQEFDFVDGRQVPRGYVARNVIEVRVDDLARLGGVMDAAVGSGATSIHGLRFDLKDRPLREREALTRAVADALARADAAASGARRTVDRVIRIDESSSRAIGPPRPELAMARMTADQAQPSTPIAEGEIEIRARVTLTAVIK